MTNAKRNWRKGYFNIKNIHKYISKKLPFCRSGWEFKFCQWLDNNPSIEKWASEPFAISYYDPVKHKVRKYFPDFYFKKIDGSKYLVEVKPNRETKPPRKGKSKSKKTMLYESNTFQTNKSKWKSATKFCEERGMTFKIITEKHLFG